MARKFRIGGTATFTWSKVVEVDDDDDPDSYDPPMYLDDVIDFAVADGDVEIESVNEVKKRGG